jgi:hypothetical protein
MKAEPLLTEDLDGWEGDSAPRTRPSLASRTLSNLDRAAMWTAVRLVRLAVRAIDLGFAIADRRHER